MDPTSRPSGCKVKTHGKGENQTKKRKERLGMSRVTISDHSASGTNEVDGFDTDKDEEATQRDGKTRVGGHR